MAHDVGFYDHKTHEIITFFFGYAGGIFYEAFEAEHCDAGMSGSNQGVLRSADQIRSGIETIKASRVYQTYLDPDRIPKTIQELEKFLDENPNAQIYIHYS